jgi:hypothetical protein
VLDELPAPPVVYGLPVVFEPPPVMPAAPVITGMFVGPSMPPQATSQDAIAKTAKHQRA